MGNSGGQERENEKPVREQKSSKISAEQRAKNECADSGAVRR